MNNRQRFFNILNNKGIGHTPYFPDISSWYENTRKNFGDEEIFGPGGYIPDGSSFNQRASSLPEKYANMTFLDYYREYDWGLPVHIADWYTTSYTGGVEYKISKKGNRKDEIFSTPKGDLVHNYILDSDGSWTPSGYMIKEKKHFEILKYIINNTHYKENYQSIEKFLQETQSFGVCDAVIWRSPFGKFVHEYLGFEQAIYSIMDDESRILDFLEIQTELDLKLAELASNSPADVVIKSDHADENLISPPHYEKACLSLANK